MKHSLLFRGPGRFSRLYNFYRFPCNNRNAFLQGILQRQPFQLSLISGKSYYYSTGPAQTPSKPPGSTESSVKSQSQEKDMKEKLVGNIVSNEEIEIEDESIISKAASLMREQKQSSSNPDSGSGSAGLKDPDNGAKSDNRKAAAAPLSQPPSNEIVVKKKSLAERIKEEMLHYWAGSKLLAYEVKISSKLLWKVARGKSLIRREERQLRRTISDIFRLVPFLIIVLVPFLELLLPFLIRLFPNMLPSTFENSFAKEEKRKKMLKVRLEMAKFLQSTMNEMALDPGNKHSEVAENFSQLFRKFRYTGEPVGTDELIKICRKFGDSLTLENLSRPQLVSMCRYMGISAFGTDNFLRYTIRNKMAMLKRDDLMILKEGVDSLSIPELQQACQTRGIACVGVSPARMKMELQQWLDLHVVNKIPSSLLILSRAFALSDPTDALRATLSSLPDTVVSEVELQASAMAGDTKSSYKQKMEVLEQQEELIADELAQEEREQLAEQAQAEAKALRMEAKAEDEKVVVEEVSGSGSGSGSSAPDIVTPKLVGDNEATAEISAKEQVVVSDEDEGANLTDEQKRQLKEALLVFSSKSPSENEREQLKELKQDHQEYQESVKELEEISEEIVKESKASSRLGQKLSKMINSLDEELQAYELDIGSKLNIIKANEKGQITVDQLETVLRMIKNHPDEDKMRDVIKKLDKDGDGLVLMKELFELAKKIEGHGSTTNDSNKS